MAHQPGDLHPDVAPLRLIPGEPTPHSYLNRELSALDYSARVLARAEDESLPLLERAKYLAFFAEQIDELFGLRVSGLKEQVVAGLTSSDGQGPTEQLRAIRERVVELIAWQDRVFLEAIEPALDKAGIILSDWDDLDADDREHLVTVFQERIFPVLTPLAVDPGHPFPFISNLSLNLAVMARDPVTDEQRFARVKVPPLLSRFVVMPDGQRFVPVEQVIAAHLHLLFPGMVIESHHPFRVTRDADLELADDGADDLLAAIEIELRRRRRGEAVRLEVAPTIAAEVRELLVRELDLSEDDVYEVESPLDLTGLFAVYDLDRPDLKDEPWMPATQPRLVGADDGPIDIFGVLRERDVLLHHPYDSFATSVEAFVEQAAADPQVLTIKQTLYRTSGDSSIVQSLITAAQRGKQVAALVELTARGDEQANIAWARQLEEAGVHVVYGLVGLKTHTKTVLVVRQEGSQLRRYCHIGTGNYNPRTARFYEDVGLLTADPDIGADLTDLFNYLTGYSRQVEYRRTLVAPVALRQKLLDLISGEAAQPDGEILFKVNNLVDGEIIDALYRASARGTKITLVVRGICCLRPGVERLSENITVRSVVGRFLEHSRVFVFGPTERRRYFIGSPDLMPRNLDRRVEAVVPVLDSGLQTHLEEALSLYLLDDSLSWLLGPDGRWQKVRTVAQVNVQQRLMERALGQARRRRETA